MLRLAVTGLRAKPYSYSWDEIAARLGVPKQAAPQRYSDKSDSNALGTRLTEAAPRKIVSQVSSNREPFSS